MLRSSAVATVQRMELRLKPTETLTQVNGTLCREWIGRDDKDRPVCAYVAVPEGAAPDFAKDGEVIEIDRPVFG